MPEQLFPLGRIVMTTNLQGKLQEANPEGWVEELHGLIARHASGNWGDIAEEDKGSITRSLRVRPNQLLLRAVYR